MAIGRPLVSPAAEAYLDVALPRLLGVALSLTGHRQDAEDLVQDSVAKVLVSWSKVERASSPDAYVRRIMVNTFLSRRRRHSASELISHATVTSDRYSAGTSSSEAGFDERDRVWQMLSTLPPRERAVMVLRHYEDLPDAAIAQILGCSPGAVRVTAHRAREKLRAHLGGPRTGAGDPAWISGQAGHSGTVEVGQSLAATGGHEQER